MITSPPDINNLHLFTDYAREEADKAGFSDTDISRIELAIEEAAVNIINYSFPDEEGEISMECDFRHQSLQITLSDNGIPFNPLEYCPPDITLPAQEREVGGLGIFLIRNLMDEVEYRREEDKNILMMRKKLSQ